MDYRDIYKQQLNKQLNNSLKSDLVMWRNWLSEEVNRRMSSLEEAGLDYGAYNKIYNYLGIIRNYRNKVRRAPITKGSHETKSNLKKQIREMDAFLQSESSTIEGQLAIRQRIVDTFRGYKHGFELKYEKSFFDFLGSEQYKNIANRGISSEMLQEWFDRTYKGTEESWNEIMSAMEEFEKGEITALTELYEKVGDDFWDYEDF